MPIDLKLFNGCKSVIGNTINYAQWEENLHDQKNQIPT
jgi:hypothetical protein